MLVVFATYYYYVLCIMLPLIYYYLFTDVSMIRPSGQALVVGMIAVQQYNVVSCWVAVFICIYYTVSSPLLGV